MAIQNWPKTATSSDWANVDSIKWPEAMLPPDVNDSARAMGRDLAKWRDDLNSTITSGGSSNAYTITSNGSYGSLANGFQLSFKASFSNTGAATLNVDSLGAKAVRKFTAAGEAALAANDIVSGGYYWVQYNTAANSAAGAWVLLNPSIQGASTVLDTVGSTQGQLLYRGASTWDPLSPGTAGKALISGGTGANPAYQPVAARAWVKFAGATGTIDQSYNVSSVTRNGAGDYTINFSTALTDTGYVVVGTIGPVPNGTGLFGVMESSTTSRTTSLVRVHTVANAGTGTDFASTQIVIFGN